MSWFEGTLVPKRGSAHGTKKNWPQNSRDVIEKRITPKN